MVLLLNEKNAEIMADADHARLWDVLIHQEKGLMSRTNFFMIGESVFLLTYGIVLSLSPEHATYFAILGLGLSLVWLILQYNTLHDLSLISNRLKRIEVSKHYLAWREESRRFIVSHEIIAVVIPALALVAWFIALAFTS